MAGLSSQLEALLNRITPTAPYLQSTTDQQQHASAPNLEHQDNQPMAPEKVKTPNKSDVDMIQPDDMDIQAGNSPSVAAMFDQSRLHLSPISKPSHEDFERILANTSLTEISTPTATFEGWRTLVTKDTGADKGSGDDH